MKIEEALCRQSDPDLWFPDVGGAQGKGGDVDRARDICARCPVRKPCARAALNGNEQYGIWAGVAVSRRTSPSELLSVIDETEAA